MRLEFRGLRSADRIEVVDLTGERTVILDEQSIQRAADFIEPRTDGWVESWRGPRQAWFDLYFFDGTEPVGSFGIAEDFITVGGYYQRVSPEDTTRLAKELGLKWPQKR